MLSAKKMKETANDHNTKELNKIISTLVKQIEKDVPEVASIGKYKYTTSSIIPLEYRDYVVAALREKYPDL